MSDASRDPAPVAAVKPRAPASPRGPGRPWLAGDLPTWTLGTIAVGVALAAAPRAIQAGDAGEFATVMLRGGVPHPSGYPWMRVLGLPARALEALGVPPALAAATPGALCTAAAWVVLYRAMVRHWLTERTSARHPGARWVLAAVVIAAACAGLVTLHGPDSEVWGLHLLLCAAFIARACGPAPARPLALGVLLGLATSHHLTASLLAPWAIAAAWPRGRTFGALLGAGLRGFAGVAVGLLPFATLAIGRGGAWRWGEVEHPAGLVHHVLRREYGLFELSLQESSAPPLAQVARTVASVAAELSAGLVRGPGGGLALLVGTVVAAAWWRAQAARARPRAADEPAVPEHTAAWAWRLDLGWLATAALATLAFPTLFDLDPGSPFGAWILARFDLLPLLLWTFGAGGAALGLLALAQRAGRPTWAALLVVLVAWPLASGWRGHARGWPAHDDGVERYALDVLASPAPGARAVVFGTDDHRTFPVLYAQAVLGAAPHVIYVDAQLLALPWYRAHLLTRAPGLPVRDKPLATIGALWQDPAWRDTPVYLANVFSRPAAALERAPEGVLMRVRPPHAGPDDWSLDAVAARHLAASARLRGIAGRPAVHHPWSADLAQIYGDGARALGPALRAAGRAGLAAAIEQRAIALVRADGSR